MSWDPRQYQRFADQRLRPARDLLAQVSLCEAREVVDLGCGTGNVTALLKKRWPQARITGIDQSPEMLARAKSADPDIDWVRLDIAAWHPAQPVDLIYSNAALQWLPDHRSLLPRLLGQLNAGGVLALQMPQTGHGHWRQILRAAVEDRPWAHELRHLAGPGHVLTPADYHRILARPARTLEIWESEFLHRLEGRDPVAEWTKGAALRPLLAALSPEEGQVFFEYYRKLIAAAYPPESDGATLLPFRRLFIVAAI
jgi:trans-aconitate 2-methyltransferase